MDIISDTHIELCKEKYIKDILLPNLIKKKKSSLLALCGDIGNVYNEEQQMKLSFFLSSLKEHYNTILYVPGNHEYYGSNKYKQSIDETEKYLKEICNKIGVILLIRGNYENEKYIIYGCTLWSMLPHDMSYYLNDLTKINGMNYNKYNELHIKDSLWLINNLNKENHKTIIVLTHHLPSHQLIDPKFKSYGELNKCYYSNMDFLFDKVNIWCCGHSHQRIDKYIENTRIIINAIGYKGQFKTIDIKTI